MKATFLGICLLLTTFPAAAQTAPAPADPAAVAEARQIVIKLLPPGTYKRVMGSTMTSMVSSMTDSLNALPLRELAQLGGMTPQDAQKLDKVNLAEVMAIYDPHWRERQQRTMNAIFGAMGDFFTTLEPELREAMAHAYAARFSLGELRDLDHYFATPTGAKFAGMQMTIMSDPAMVAEMKGMMPKIMQQMPHFIEAAKTATKDLPAPRKIQDMTPAERAKIAHMLDVDENKLADPKVAP